MDESSKLSSGWKKNKLSPFVQKLFIQHYVPDRLEWKMCTKIARTMVVSKSFLATLRRYTSKSWLEDTSFDATLRLVLNNGEGPALMLPDQIALPMFHILKPTELRFCGHFRCDEKRLENIVEIIGEGITSLELYNLTTERDAKWLLSRCSSHLKYLACDVAYLGDYLNSPIKLDRFLAYYGRRDLKCALSWIFEAVDTKVLDLGVHLFTSFSSHNLKGPCRERLTHLIMIGTMQKRNDTFEFLSSIKQQAPNLRSLELKLYLQAPSSEESKRWTTSTQKLIEFANRLQTCISTVHLNLTVMKLNRDGVLPDVSLFGHPARLQTVSDNDFDETHTRITLVDAPITFAIVCRPMPVFHFETM